MYGMTVSRVFKMYRGQWVIKNLRKPFRNRPLDTSRSGIVVRQVGGWGYTTIATKYDPMNERF